MATWDELKCFKWEELPEMQLSWCDLKNKSIEELLLIAQGSLDRFKSLPPDKQGALAKSLPLAETILATVAANLVSNAIESVDWKDLILEVIKLFAE